MTLPKKSLLLALAVLLVAGLGYYFFQKRGADDPARRYKTEALAMGDVVQTVSANGTLNPVTLVNVGTQVSGTVNKLYVDFNDQVKEGQVLAELDDAIYAAQVRQSDATVANAQASQQLARASEARMQALFQDEYVSRQELDQAVQARASAEAQLRLARAQNDRDRANLANSVIRSPVSGVVIARQVDIGQTVAASFQTPTLFQIAQDLTQMQIYTTFAEADIGAIRVGQPATFNVDAFANRSFRGKVKQLRLNPTTQQNVVTYNVVVEVDNPDKLLLPGMTAYVNIAVAEKKNVLLVPNTALRFKPAEADRPAADAGPGAGNNARGAPPAAGSGAPGRRGGNGAPQGPRGEHGERGAGGAREGTGATLYVLAGQRIEARRVRIGITDSRFSEVLAGDLKAGDAVIVGENLGNAAPPASSSNFRMRLF